LDVEVGARAGVGAAVPSGSSPGFRPLHRFRGDPTSAPFPRVLFSALSTVPGRSISTSVYRECRIPSMLLSMYSYVPLQASSLLLISSQYLLL
jgi:hypothetical protein